MQGESHVTSHTILSQVATHITELKDVRPGLRPGEIDKVLLTLSQSQKERNPFPGPSPNFNPSFARGELSFLKLGSILFGLSVGVLDLS